MKNINYIFLLMLPTSCMFIDHKKSLLKDWNTVQPLLVAEANKNHDCIWKLEKQDVIDVALDESRFKKRLLSDKKISCNSSTLYLVTFSSYCGGSETDAFVSARILNCDQEYKIFSLSLTEE